MQSDSSLNFLPQHGEASRQLRELDWASTSIGSPHSWPQNLRTALSLCLTSKFPILIWWGPDLTVLYNDAYIPFLGRTKHPGALGRPGRECWSEIWDTIGPMLESVYRTGDATWSYDSEYFFDRDLPREEVYVTFTYGPILAADGVTVEGVFCPCSETTEKIVSARRLETLRRLGAQLLPAADASAAAHRVCEVLADSARDVPFCLIYAIQHGNADLLASVGAHDEARAAVNWPLDSVARTNEPQTVALAALGLTLPGGPWEDQAAWARILPIRWTADGQASGVMVLGVSSRRPLDAAYRDFLELVAHHSAGAIANAVAYQAEQRRAEALAELDRAKTAFFSNVSHEFRTPLTLILGPLEQALAEADGQIGKETADLLYRNGLRLQKLVNSLLDFARIEGGGMSARAEPTDLARATADHVSVFRAAIEAAGLALNLHCDELSMPISVDRDHYEKIVSNLLSNAFKYTLQGSIDVALQDQGNCVALSVRDSGVGMSRNDLSRIFQRFYRGNAPAARSHEGSGIGLALTLELVRLQGGEIMVTSEEGVGSVFTVTLPKAGGPMSGRNAAIETADSPRRSPVSVQYAQEMSRWRSCEAPVVSPAQTTRPRVLCADDNIDLRDYIRGLLAPTHEVQLVPDGASALHSALQDPPDLIITDIMMPGMSGLTLLQSLRDDPRTRTVPVILLSARAGPEARVEGMEAGADDYLIKPFSPSELQARVAAHLRLTALRREVEQELREAHVRKDEFLAVLAHELRNPLAPLNNGLRLLRAAGHGDDKSRHILTMLERQVRHLARLVDDLLDIARISSGKISLRKEPVDIVEVLRNAVEACRGAVDTAGHSISVSLPDRPVVMDADEVRLTQAISNLLTNATKYTERGGHILVNAGSELDGGFVISVRDSGRGIPQDMLKRVFDPFVQVSGELGEGGLGIGLTLVRRLVELHGGTVDARSDGLGAGSEFLLRLPMAASAPAAMPPSPTSAPAEHPLGRIMVVDDNTDSGDTTAMVLETFGAQVRVAQNGATALTMLDTFDPQVMLVDIGMPGMDGHELARRVRHGVNGARVTLIAMTGWGQEDDRQRSKSAGFDHHLVKPVDFDALEALLTELAQRRSERDPMQSGQH